MGADSFSVPFTPVENLKASFSLDRVVKNYGPMGYLPVLPIKGKMINLGKVNSVWDPESDLAQ